jgi:hypothetical protein
MDDGSCPKFDAFQEETPWDMGAPLDGKSARKIPPQEAAATIDRRHLSM